MLAYIKVCYQDFYLNAAKFSIEDLSIRVGKETQICTFTVDNLKEFGFEFEDDCSYVEYAQAIFQMLNHMPDELDIPQNKYKIAGHTSMSVGDFLLFEPVDRKEPVICYVCASAGWKVIEDYNGFVSQYSSFLNAMEKMSVNVVEAMAFTESQDPIGFRNMFKSFKGHKCENHCPKCNSEDIDWADKDWFDDGAYQKATCNECGCEFKEYYKYSNTEIEEF